ncbi:MAG: VOC family protein, partial [Gammaproteobacteria bacterium]|nr:VOC family protein [Gemmatimonadota bacterium]NIU74030.1 VOC family protein [Gammaproteobacteria bacterium]NIX38403.1 VOC family protein [Gemmatimonadota bacterium]
MSPSTRRRIDHLVHAVDDLDAAAAAYEDLGFLVTPRADHPFGTSNRLVILDR